MAYTDDAVLAKLSALNETQESIVTVAQWVMFHRRHADRTAQLWLSRLKDSGSNKRLNLIYLANEVAQQSKARKKDDFLIAFSPVIAEATASAYKGATSDVQLKIRRVVEVWRQRQVFEIPIQDAVEARIEEIDKSKTSGKRGGGSIFSSNTPSSVPSDLVPLVEPQQTITKLVLSTRTSTNAASQDYDKLMGPSANPPTAPVYAARLNGLLKTLANAEGAVAESIKARKLLIEGLEKMLGSNREALTAEEKQLEELAGRKKETDAKKKSVEDNIMRDIASNSNPGTPNGPPEGSPGASRNSTTPAPEPDRPEVEALTPPDFPRPPSTEPIPEFDLDYTNSSASAANSAHSISIAERTITQAPSAGSDLLSSLATSYGRPTPAASGGTVKKRKLNDEFPDLGGDAMDGLDADVAEMLAQDGRNVN
ncbi:putative Regulator of Ty1 Transposition [Venustampulla echinocandica]|uniref:Putative Regulator of Ty1 Transposition n=1 Tax=Venustampulla echinocandica TaxID=2656787 RepID=A0A370TPF3_9HELO|nr:putative Regulator of Ty1 Transposition [Venustampulla echinocandica]RDL37388.1 putative Regulator of Ty1 Transposition [Venustampulla echinocandica]